jgi:hypothetical protein
MPELANIDDDRQRREARSCGVAQKLLKGWEIRKIRTLVRA